MSGKEYILHLFDSLSRVNYICDSIAKGKSLQWHNYLVLKRFVKEYRSKSHLSQAIVEAYTEAGVEPIRTILIQLRDETQQSLGIYDEGNDINIDANALFCLALKTSRMTTEDTMEYLAETLGILTNYQEFLDLGTPTEPEEDEYLEDFVDDRIAKITETREILDSLNRQLDRIKTSWNNCIDAISIDDVNATRHSLISEINRFLDGTNTSEPEVATEASAPVAPEFSKTLLKKLWRVCDHLFSGGNEDTFIEFANLSKPTTPIEIRPQQKSKVYFLIYVLSLCLNPNLREQWEVAALTALGIERIDVYKKTRNAFKKDYDMGTLDDTNKEFVTQIMEIVKPYHEDNTLID